MEPNPKPKQPIHRIHPPMSDSHSFISNNHRTFTCSDTNMPTGPSYVYKEIQDMPTEYQEIDDMLVDSFDGIPVSCLETRYKEKFKRSLDYNSLGVETIEELLVKMRDEGVVFFYTHPESNEGYVTYARCRMEFSEIQDMPTKFSDVYEEIQYILTGYARGVRMYRLEEKYYYEFGKLPDYGSVGVKDIKELIGKMHEKGRVLVFDEPERKETYVMCAWMAERVWIFLKRHLLKLLDAHGGEIPLSCFERRYKDTFELELKYHYYGLKDIYHLCQVLNLGIEEADSQGEKVIKAGKIYNLRKRKING